MLVSIALGALAQEANPLTRAFQSRYEAVKKNLVESAEVMPESGYAFRLTAGQRPFGEWIGHTAMGNYQFCAAIRGVSAPDTTYLHALRTKAELVKALNDSFGYCDQALEGLTDSKALKPAKIGNRTAAPVDGMFALIGSDNEHYGNLVGYLRSRGIVPPSSARRK